MIYITYDSDNNLTGYYNQELSEDHESNYLELEEELPKSWVQYKINEEHTAVVELPEPDNSKELNNTQILQELQRIDLASIRALREGNVERINNWENEATTLRARLIK